VLLIFERGVDFLGKKENNTKYSNPIRMAGNKNHASRQLACQNNRNRPFFYGLRFRSGDFPPKKRLPLPATGLSFLLLLKIPRRKAASQTDPGFSLAGRLTHPVKKENWFE
jgi:hypothetical protein